MEIETESQQHLWKSKQNHSKIDGRLNKIITKSMEHLKKFSKVIYINTPLEIIMERIDIDQKRGLAVPEGMSIPEIYSEREPMYQKYCETILDGSKTIDQLVGEAIKQLHE